MAGTGRTGRRRSADRRLRQLGRLSRRGRHHHRRRSPGSRNVHQLRRRIRILTRTPRLAAIGLLAASVTAALYAVGRLHAPDYTVSPFGQAGLAAVTLKSLLATVVLGLAVVQVLLALWLYRKLPLAARPP